MKHYKNRYIKRSQLLEKQFKEILRYFAADLSATATANLTHISRQTNNMLFDKLRHRLFIFSVKTQLIKGEYEIDEFYFGVKRVLGKRGRGAADKTPVFGILKRSDNVFVHSR